MTKNKKLILRLSNEIGNQMFMYASAFSIAKQINRDFFIDNETAFLLKITVYIILIYQQKLLMMNLNLKI